MLDQEKTVSDRIEFYRKDIDNPHTVNGFRGTWAISAHSLIPEVFNGLLTRHFGQYRIRRIPLDQINELLNELWEGPGSLEKIFNLEHEYKLAGKEIKFAAADIADIKKKSKEEEEVDNLPELALSMFGNDDDNE
tara:strand:+ start:1628 stop:2032 length:405 start_codon:yes stop_codon:yes gene_type:complete